MMKNKICEDRRQRLRELIDTKYKGNVARFSRSINRSPSYVARMLYPEGKAGKRGIAERMMRIIEEAENLPRG